MSLTKGNLIKGCQQNTKPGTLLALNKCPHISHSHGWVCSVSNSCPGGAIGYPTCQSIINSPYQGVLSQLVPIFHHCQGEGRQRELFLWRVNERETEGRNDETSIESQNTLNHVHTQQRGHLYTAASVFGVEGNGKFIKDFPLSSTFRKEEERWAKEENTDVNDLKRNLGWNIYQITTLRLVFFLSHVCGKHFWVFHILFLQGESQRQRCHAQWIKTTDVWMGKRARGAKNQRGGISNPCFYLTVSCIEAWYGLLCIFGVVWGGGRKHKRQIIDWRPGADTLKTIRTHILCERFN